MQSNLGTVSQNQLKNFYSITYLNGRKFLPFNFNHSRISHGMHAVKQVISEEEKAIGLASFSSKRKEENAELSNSIETRKETVERGLDQLGRNDPSDIVSEGSTKKRAYLILCLLIRECVRELKER